MNDMDKMLVLGIDIHLVQLCRWFISSWGKRKCSIHQSPCNVESIKMPCKFRHKVSYSINSYKIQLSEITDPPHHPLPMPTPIPCHCNTIRSYD